jgi:hypothetical protein
MSRALATSTLNAAASESASEYLLLKAKNHLSGFSDKVTEDDADSLLLRDVSAPWNERTLARIPLLTGEIDASSTSVSGALS